VSIYEEIVVDDGGAAFPEVDIGHVLLVNYLGGGVGLDRSCGFGGEDVLDGLVGVEGGEETLADALFFFFFYGFEFGVERTDRSDRRLG